jgi:hypothetical protein
MPADIGRIVGANEDITLAVALCRTHGQGTHLGVVYRDGNSVKLIHFAFMHDLREDDFSRFRNRYVCAVPDLLPATLAALAGYFRRIASKYANRGSLIAYNLAPVTGAGFDPDTEDYAAGPNGEGFSCATFVVHAFRSAGHRILDTAGWPTGRPGDRRRQLELIQELRNHGHSTWADRVENNELGCPRIAPEEVAGACLENAPPASFLPCERHGRLLLTILDWQAASTKRFFGHFPLTMGRHAFA